MDIRLKCSCGAPFFVSEAMRGRAVACPKCKGKVRVPPQPVAASARRAVPAAATSASAAPVKFVAADPSELKESPPQSVAPAEPEPQTAWHSHAVAKASDEPRGAGWKWLLLLLILLVPVGIVGTLIALPYFEKKDPREAVAERYLQAVRRDDWDTATRLSVLTTHPRLTGVERVGQPERESPAVRGKFQGLAAFHAETLKQYTYNSDRGRFAPKDELGLGLGVLSQLEQAKKKAEAKVAENQADPARKRKSPEDQMLDDALANYGAIGDLASNVGGLLSSQKLGPTYEDLLKQTKVPLTDAEQSLAAHYLRDPAKWDRLLGRSFLDLPDLGEFTLEEVELLASIRTEGQSHGEPGRPIKLRLVRFTMGSIDTGWRVWQAE